MGTIIKKYSQLLLLAACFTLFSGCDFKPATASLENTVWEHEFSQEDQNPNSIKKAVLYFNNQTLTYYALSADGRKKTPHSLISVHARRASAHRRQSARHRGWIFLLLQ